MELNTVYFGIRLWIWLICIINLFSVTGAFIYFWREYIRKQWYTLRHPDKLVKIIIHNKTGIFREYWRIIPDNKFFKIGDKVYEYDDTAILKNNEIFAQSAGQETVITVDKQKYNIDRALGIKKVRRKWPEFHYFYNVPTPIKFDFSTKDIKFSASQLDDFKENDLFSKLLTLREEKNLLTMILVFVIISTFAIIIVALKVFNVIKYTAK